MDYNIKFKYEGAGKGGGSAKNAMATRQRVLQAQQNAGNKPGTSQPSMNRELITSITKLIASNKSLERAVSRSSGRGGGGGGGGGGSGLTNQGLGGIGSSIPFAGAIIAGIGYAVSKINQIGNAYIELASQQIGTAGVAGFRRGRRGMYLQTDVGGMEKAHRMSAGRFGSRTARSVSERAMQVGTIFGMGASEIGGISGTFARGGGNFARTVETAAGGGIETEMPLLLQGMASVLEEAVTNGVNSSSLADDLGDQIVSLTRASQTNSVGMAMGIVRNRRGVQQQVAQGQIGSYEQYTAFQAAGTSISRRLADPARREEYLSDLVSRGLIDAEELTGARGRATAAGRDLNLSDLESIGPNVGPLLRRLYSARGESDQQSDMVSEIVSNFGRGARGTRGYISANVSSLGINEQLTMLGARDVPEGARAAGAADITSRYGAATGNRAFGGVRREGERQELLMEHGRAFADLSIIVERSLIRMTKAIMPTAANMATFTNEIERLLNTTTPRRNMWQRIGDALEDVMI